jgi:hypothetical protein
MRQRTVIAVTVFGLTALGLYRYRRRLLSRLLRLPPVLSRSFLRAIRWLFTFCEGGMKFPQRQPGSPKLLMTFRASPYAGPSTLNRPRAARLGLLRSCVGMDVGAA